MVDENVAILDEASTGVATLKPNSGFIVAEGQDLGYFVRKVQLRRPSNVFLIDTIAPTDLDGIMGNAYGIRSLMGGMDVPTGGNAYRAIRETRPAAEPRTALPFYTPGEIVSIVRAALSLNITELAKVLQVKRPTIYAWLGERAEPQGHNVRRLNELLGVARYWMRRTNTPLGAFVRQADRTGQSLVDLLSKEVLVQEDIVERLTALQKKLLVVSKQKKGIRQSALKHGIDPSQAGDQQDVIDWLTGKRPESE